MLIKKREIGKTGVEVFSIGLGAMPLSIQGRPSSEKEAIAAIHASIDAGVNFIDTANAYCLDQKDIGHNERLIAKALKQKDSNNKIYVATKGGCIRPDGRWEVDGRPESLHKACEKSLEDLQTDNIFLYQWHAPDSKVPFEDSIGALKKLQDEGKIRYLGLSNVNADQIEKALNITRIESVQNRCNPSHRVDFNNGVIDLCQKNQMTYIAYSPVGGGFHHVALNNAPILKELAEKYQASTYCIILGWLLSMGDHILPIPGARRIESATDSPKAAQLSVEKEDLKKISLQR